MEKSKCPECGDTGLRDTGGVYPWGEGISVPCDHGAFIAVPGQAFTSFQQWVNKAPSWLTGHPEYRNTEHAKIKGWQGAHFTALCFDQKGRRCRSGADMQRARDEGSFPVWWVWPDQIAELIMDAAIAAKEPT